MHIQDNWPKVSLNNITFTIMITLSLIFLLIDELNFALPVYILSYFSIIVFVGYFLKFGLRLNKINILLLFFILYLFFLIIYSLVTNDLDGIRYSAKILVFICLLFLMSTIKYDKTKILMIAIVFTYLPIVNFLQWISSIETFKYTGIFNNPNTLGISIYLALFIHILLFNLTKNLLAKFLITLVILLDVLLLFLSSSRAVWISLMIGVLVYFIFKFISKNKLIYRICYLFTVASIISYSYLYPKLQETKIGIILDDFIIEYTGKSFYSGRQDLWLYIINLIEQKKILGYGVSTTLSDVMLTGFTAHNTYLSVILQTGILGFLIYLILLFLIWDLLYFKVDKLNSTLKIFPAFFISLLIYQTFELSFMQGRYSLGVIEMMFVAMGISMISNENDINK